MKRLISLLLSVTLFFLPITSAWEESMWNVAINADAIDATASGVCGEDLIWDFDEDTKTLTISGTGKMTSCEGWDKFRTEIKRLVINNGVTSIGNL